MFQLPQCEIDVENWDALSPSRTPEYLRELRRNLQNGHATAQAMFHVVVLLVSSNKTELWQIFRTIVICFISATR